MIFFLHPNQSSTNSLVINYSLFLLFCLPSALKLHNVKFPVVVRGVMCPLRFLSQVDFKMQLSKYKKNRQIIFFRLDTMTPV